MSAPAEAESSISTPPKRFMAEAGARRATVSPSYMSKRHSLFGTEDRIVIDPGARVWKVGFSGEPDPRAAFWAAAEVEHGEARTGAGEMWDLDLGAVAGARGSRIEARRLVAARIDRKMRDVYHKHLLTDGKARKVLVLENTFLPIFVKEEIARSLFEDLRVPSVAFTPSSVLALGSCGRITGLVVDCGWLETTVTPVYGSRPLYHLARSSPLAGRALHTRLRALLRHYGQYRLPARGIQPPSPAAVQLGILSDRVVERVLSESCFVSHDKPNGMPRGSAAEPAPAVNEIDDAALMAVLADRYRGSTAAEWHLSIPNARGHGPSTLIVPGWIRERAAEVLFGDGPDEAESISELVLDTLVKLPVDIRATLASAVLVTGGMSSLPGMIPRLRADVLNQLPEPMAVDEDQNPRSELNAWRRRVGSRYHALQGLSHEFSVLNDPAPMDGKTTGRGGSAPRWAPPLLPWIGGSLAGALKTSGPEVLREDYDARVTDSLSRGETFHELLQEARGDEPSPTAGLALEDLRPGMAVGILESQRKRGWTASGALPDWTTARVHAGAV